MRYVKTLGLLTMAATALMAFATAASATTLTDKTNAAAPYAGTIEAMAAKTTFIGSLATVTCDSLGIDGDVTDPGGVAEDKTVKITLSSMAFSECTGSDVTVTKPGVFEIHTDKKGTNDGNGTVTWVGGALSVQHTALGSTCEYTASATDVGTIDGSRKTVDNKHPTAVVTTKVVIPRTGGSFLCGSTVEMAGDWTITTPDYLDVD